MNTSKTLQHVLVVSSLALIVSNGSAQLTQSSQTPAQNSVQIQVNPQLELTRLLKAADADKDKKITVDDLHNKNSVHTKSLFWLEDTSKRVYEVSGVYHLSNLLQELKLAADNRMSVVRSDRIFENPVERVSRSIKELYWNGLTRRVDAAHLAQALPDSKLPKSEWRHLYVPAGDQIAFDYFEKVSRQRPELKLKVWRLPAKLGENFMQDLDGRHGLLTLALEQKPDGTLSGVPFVVPGGRFNEMYGWDSYFEALGLLNDGRIDLAKAMIDNFVYQIENYGKILNANRSYYLNRSQPPFLTPMITAVYERLEKNSANKKWLSRSLQAAITEYETVWMNPDRLTNTGLSRYYGNGRGIPPETEGGHFDYILKPAAKKHRLTVAQLVKRYNAGEIKDPALDDFFAQDRAVRESGHDTTYRWRVGKGDRAADFVTVDLNSLLYQYELDIARLIRKEFGDRFTLADQKTVARSAQWRERAQKRKALMLKYMWDESRKMFFDYNFKDQARSQYVSATAFYPLWAQDPEDTSTRMLERGVAEASATALLSELEAPGGIASTSPKSLEKYGDPKHERQWEYPNGWAPHQMIAWKALRSYGLSNTADRLTYKWLYTIAFNAANYNGTVPEKFNVVTRSHAVFAEYGNVGTEFSYITQEGFGWMNASYQVGLSQMAPQWKPHLSQLKPPEWVSFDQK